VALTIASVAALVTGCSSSGASDGATSSLTIPSPFEVGQTVGAGDLTLRVRSFQHDGRALSVVVDATNETAAPITIAPTRAFKVFYGSRRHPAVKVDGPVTPIPAGSTASYTATFDAPARYKFPLLWFTTGAPGAHATTVVLRGAGSPPASSTPTAP
jgi:hypothetical protein